MLCLPGNNVADVSHLSLWLLALRLSFSLHSLSSSVQYLLFRLAPPLLLLLLPLRFFSAGLSGTEPLPLAMSTSSGEEPAWISGGGFLSVQEGREAGKEEVEVA